MVAVAVVLVACQNPTTADTGTDDDTESSALDERLVATSPAHQSTDASVWGRVTLTFAADMDGDSFDGNVTVSTDSGETAQVTVSSYDSATRELTVTIPDSLQDDGFRRLYPETTYTVTVDGAAKTAGGEPLGTPVSFSFTTFQYQLLHDDTGVIDDQVFGIRYHPATDMLFYDGMNSSREVMIRRYNVGLGQAATVVPAASTQGTYGGLDLYGDLLYLNETYDAEVTEYQIQSDGTLAPTGNVYANPTLSAPTDTLSEVQDTARIGDSLYFSTGRYTTGDQFLDIIAYDTGTDTWSTFRTASTWGFDSNTDHEITAVTGGSTPYLYLADNDAGTLYRFSPSGGGLSVQTDILGHTMDLDHDSAGDIYLASFRGIFKLSPDMEVLDSRPYAPASRIAVKETADGVRVFFVEARSPARIGYVDF